MLLLDVNVVLAAARPDHPRHTEVRPWFDGMLGGQETFGVPMTVWASFLRLVTSRRVFAVPSTLEEAFAFVDAVRAQPLHRPAEPGGAHVEVLRRLCREAEATGDLVPDAVLAAIAVERACTVATLDRDFARFAEVEHVRPTTRS